MDECRSCEREFGDSLGHHARGLCWTCWTRHRAAGTLDEFSRSSRCRSDRTPVGYTAEDYRFLRSTGETFDGAAARLGIKSTSLRQALWRAGASAVYRAG